MKQRIISGTALLLIMFFVINYAPFFLFWLFFAITAGISIWEYSKLIFTEEQKAEIRTNTPVKKFFKLNFIYILFAIYTLFPFISIYMFYSSLSLKSFSNYLSLADKFQFYAIGVLVLSIVAIYRNTEHIQKVVSPYLIAISTAILNSAFFISVFLVRYYNPDLKFILFENSSSLFFYLIILIAASDSGAYFVGKNFGKTKLSPTISPNKTVEGLVGGVVSAFAISLIYTLFFNVPAVYSFSDSMKFILLSMVVVAISVHGDLFESFLKRRVNIKDSSNLIPGHGGVLDRLDSLTPAFIVFSFFWLM